MVASMLPLHIAMDGAPGLCANTGQRGVQHHSYTPAPIISQPDRIDCPFPPPGLECPFPPPLGMDEHRGGSQAGCPLHRVHPKLLEAPSALPVSGKSPLPRLLGRLVASNTSDVKHAPVTCAPHKRISTPPGLELETSPPSFCCGSWPQGELSPLMDKNALGASFTRDVGQLPENIKSMGFLDFVEDQADDVPHCSRHFNDFGSGVKSATFAAGVFQHPMLQPSHLHAPLAWRVPTQTESPSWPTPEVLSTGEPPLGLFNMLVEPPPPPSVLDAAVAGFNTGLPGAATIAAALSSAAHGVQVPRRQHASEQDEAARSTELFSQSPIAQGGAAVATRAFEPPPGLDLPLMHSSHSDVPEKLCQTTEMDIVDEVVSSNAPRSENAISTRLVGDSETVNRVGPSQPRQQLACKFVFTGIDLQRDANFELVPRLIGRRGEHMRQIAEKCKGKVRIRGRGSGHKEQQKGRRNPVEADVPLQIALSCKDRHSFEHGKNLVVELLHGMSMHFERYCRMHHIDPVPALYTIVGGPHD